MSLFIGLLNGYSISFLSLCVSPLHNCPTVCQEDSPWPFHRRKRWLTWQFWGKYFLIDCRIIAPKLKCKQMNGLCLCCQCEWILFRLSPLARTSCPPSLFPILSTESARAKLHLGALQPLCLSGWFTLHRPGLGLPGPHYQLLATGTHCSWQTPGRGTLQKFRQWKKGLRRSCLFTAAAQSPGPNIIHEFRFKGGKNIHFYHEEFHTCFKVCVNCASVAFFLTWKQLGFMLIDDYLSSKYLITNSTHS